MFNRTMAGSFHLFRLFGISVYLHWAWFLVLAYVIVSHDQYDNRLFNVIEFVALFGIVLSHEFGHALACRSVGGRSEHIVLWPLGGVAFVQPPQRPGATLWSIVAGPLVNVALFPVLWLLASRMDVTLQLTQLAAQGDVQHLIAIVFYMNVAIFIFNMLPVYPLDGGQILQSLLWFVVGRSTSLQVATAIGLLAGAGIALLALLSGQLFLLLVALFIMWQSYSGYRASRVMAQQEQWGG